MSSESAIAEPQRQLSALADLSLAMAKTLEAAASATDDVKEMIRLADAFAKVAKGMRMCIALSMRLTPGAAPARGASKDRELNLEADDEDDFDELDELDKLDDEERLETERLFDRLPSGPLPIQIASIARGLGAAARALPRPVADTCKARCDAIVAEAAGDLPVRPNARPPPAGGTIVRLDRTPTRPRGPPWRD